jgi:tripartite ATP-independent transporter DctM subunit
MELYFLGLLVVLMVIALASGYPVAFALPGAAILTIVAAAGAGYIGAGDTGAYFAEGGGPVEWLSAGVTNFRGIYWEVERDTLIAIPLFIFMGIMLQRSKIAEDLLVTMAQLFGPIPGGLGISVVFVGALLAATTGIVGATVVAMGLISLPAMLSRNYSPALASGTICASGTLGQIIPPSIVLIILADQLASAVDQAGTARKELYKSSTGELTMPSEFGVVSTSAGDMFLGAFVPGILLVLLYMAFILIFAFLRPKYAPAVHYEGKYDGAFWGKVFITLVPPLALIFLVLGSIIGGIATVNQAGAIGAAGAMIMAGYRLKQGSAMAFAPALLALVAMAAILWVTSNYDTNIKSVDSAEDEFGIMAALVAVGLLILSLIWSGWRVFRIEDTLRGVMIETAKTTSLVFIILLGAAMLTSAFRAFGGEELVKEFLNTLPGGFWTQFIIVMVVIFVLGFFLDFIEIAVVVVPIVAPILLADPSANVTAVWLGVMIGLNIQTSFLTPPFGFALFYLRGVAPSSVKTTQIYKGVIAFIALQLAALTIVGFNPSLVNYLPNRLSLTAETAPPPLNPKLQYCMENFVSDQFAERAPALKSAIDTAEGLDISYLPKSLRSDIEKSFDAARGTFDNMARIEAAEAEVADQTAGYKPLHVEVRSLTRRIDQIDGELEELEVDMRRADDEQVKARMAAHIKELEAEKASIEAEIPAEWEPEHERFKVLTKAESDARRDYRRGSDRAYEPIAEAMELIKGGDPLAEQRGILTALRADIDGLDKEQAEERIREAERAMDVASDTNDIRSPLSKARREYRRTPDMEVVLEKIDEAIENFETEVAWRQNPP